MNRFAVLMIMAQMDAVAEIDNLRETLCELQEDSEKIQMKADKEKRELTADEDAAITANLEKFNKVQASITRRQQMATNAAGLEKSQKRLASSAEISSPSEDALKDKAGYLNFGEFTKDLKLSIGSRHGAPKVTDKFEKFLNSLPSSYGSEGSNADGGYAIPPDFRTNIMNYVYGEDALISKTDQYVTGGNAVTMPVDVTSAWGATGVQAYWESEAGQLTTSKMALQQQTIRCHKLAALVPVTDELLEDAAALSGYLDSKVKQKFAFKINDALINGLGSGMPLGMMNSGCKITVAAVSGQGANTVIAKNVEKMWGRRYIANQGNLVWLINQDVEEQLQDFVLTSAVATGGIWPLYMPPGGISGSPYATLKGRPVIVMESCQALGTEGDIILADMSQYMTVLKTGGIKSDVSIHLWFDYDLTAYRFTMRMGGQPWWPTALARKNSNNTVSPIITLNSTRT